MFNIELKNKSYNGKLANITFINGYGKTDTLSEVDKKWFESYGHKVTEETKKEKK